MNHIRPNLQLSIFRFLQKCCRLKLGVVTYAFNFNTLKAMWGELYTARPYVNKHLNKSKVADLTNYSKIINEVDIFFKPLLLF